MATHGEPEGFIKIAEYAFWRGVSSQTIDDKIKKGIIGLDAVFKPPVGPKYIHKVRADKYLDAVTKGRISNKDKNVVGEVPKAKLKDVKEGGPTKRKTNYKEIIVEGKKVLVHESNLHVLGLGESNGDRLARLKIEKATIDNELNDIKIRTQRGELIDKKTIKKATMKAFGDAKEQILNIPDQYGPELLACTDLVDLQTMLQGAINKAFKSVEDFVNKLSDD